MIQGQDPNEMLSTILSNNRLIRIQIHYDVFSLICFGTTAVRIGLFHVRV